MAVYTASVECVRRGVIPSRTWSLQRGNMCSRQAGRTGAFEIDSIVRAHFTVSHAIICLLYRCLATSTGQCVASRSAALISQSKAAGSNVRVGWCTIGLVLVDTVGVTDWRHALAEGAPARHAPVGSDAHLISADPVVCWSSVAWACRHTFWLRAAEHDVDWMKQMIPILKMHLLNRTWRDCILRHPNSLGTECDAVCTGHDAWSPSACRGHP